MVAFGFFSVSLSFFGVFSFVLRSRMGRFFSFFARPFCLLAAFSIYLFVVSTRLDRGRFGFLLSRQCAFVRFLRGFSGGVGRERRLRRGAR
jgi:hypothetical protein